jgi:NitT/TauT family transport system ATP-binding protein
MELVVDNIRHNFGGLTVLDGISFTVAEGEILAVIGPSGCGKSTLLSILGGILQAADGKVYTRGEPPSNSLNPLTYIFQDFSLLPWRTVEANVMFPLEHHSLSQEEIRARVDDVLARTSLSDFKTAFPKQLSGGMRQRVGIARALVVNPAILLMDEPLSALDAQTRELLMEDFLSLWLRERMTAVYVTHNLSEALYLADRVCVLSRRPGRIREIVTVDIPQSDRKKPVAQARLAELHDAMWKLIRGEAQEAEREMSHG